MKKINFLAFAIIASVVLLSGFAAFYPSGAPAGYTGSPGDGSNCSSCHGAAATTTAGWITSDIPAAGYTPGQAYQITATNNMAGSGKYGYEISPQNSTGTLLGTLTTGTNSKLVGSGKYITHSSASSSTKTWTFSWTAPAAGTGSVTFYGAFARGYSGSTTLSTLVVSENSASPPAAAGAITGSKSVCSNSSGNYSVGAISGATGYVWSVPAGATITAGQGTTAITVSFSANAVSGNISVYGTNGSGNGTAGNLAVTVGTVPAQPAAITGAATPCQGSSQNYSVTNVAGITYTWVVPAGWSITAGQGSNSLTATVGTAAGNVQVTPSNTCGNGTARTLATTVNLVPAQPTAITGSATPCQGSSQNYSVTNVAGITYTWVVPAGWSITAGQGSNSLTATVGTAAGNVQVTPSNTCGNGTARTLATTVNLVPAQPTAITGLASPCQGSSQTYSTTNVAGVTYSWVVPAGWSVTAGQGTNSITATVGTAGGNVQVTPSTSCGNGSLQTSAITVELFPGIAASITGPDNIDLIYSSTTDYTSAAVSNADSYQWELSPAGAGSISGTGATATVTWNSGFLGVADVSVKAINACGEGGWSAVKSTTVAISTGIPSKSAAPGMTVYPSPGTGTFTVTLNGLSPKVNLRILDVTGHEMYKSTVHGSKATTLDTKLAPGVYFIQAQEGSTNLVKKIVIR